MQEPSGTRKRVGRFILYTSLLVLTLRLLANELTHPKIIASSIGLATGLLLAFRARHKVQSSNIILYVYGTLFMIAFALPPIAGIALGKNILIEVALWLAITILTMGGILDIYQKINRFDELT